MNIRNKNVLIIGPPASGKTTLAKELWLQNELHVPVHTDDYMQHGYKESLYVLMGAIKGCQCLIVEGVLGYRLLRKGMEVAGVWKPDLVIELQVTAERQANIYRTERSEEKLKYLRNFNNAHQKILNDYFELVGDARPEWIKMNINL